MKRIGFTLTLSTFGKRHVMALKSDIALSFSEVNQLEQPLLRGYGNSIQKLFKQLFQEELFYRTQEGKDLQAEKSKKIQLFRIRPSSAKKLLQECQIEAKLCWEGTQLIPDFVTPHTLELHFEDTLFVLGAINSLSTSWEITNTLNFIPGPPHMVLKPPFLKIFHEEISWRIIEHLTSPDKLLTILEEELGELPTNQEVSPFSEYIKIYQEVSLPLPDPKPLLKLTDATLGFAILYMEYPLSDGACTRYSFLSKENSNKRQLQKEAAWEATLLAAGFTRRPIGLSDYFCPLDRAANGIEKLLNSGWRIVNHDEQELQPITKISISRELKPQVEVANSHLSFATTLQEVAKEVTRGSRLLPLSSKIIGFLPTNTFTAISELLQEVEWYATATSCTPKIAKAKWSVFEPTFHAIPLAASDIPATPLNPHTNFQGHLRHYQEEGFRWLFKRYQQGLSSLLADDMGLGKTVQLIALFSRLSGPIIVIMPKSLLPNWKAEIQRFLPTRTIHLYEGISRDKVLSNLSETDVILTSYTTARIDIEKLAQLEFELVVLDEAQAIKNKESLTAKALTQLSSTCRICLTGTPIENSLQDLLGYFQFLEPTLLQGIEGPLEEHLLRIKRLTRPFILRRRKEDVLEELPPLLEQNVYVDMTEEQSELYTSFFSSLKAGLIEKIRADGAAAHKMEILEGILRLRQICCHPQLIQQFAQNEQNTITSGKFDTVIEDLQTLISEGKKIVLFSQFSSMLHVVAKKAKERDWPYLVLEGATLDRGEVVAAFTQNASPTILLATLKTGGVGLNLQAADAILLYDPWWNKAVESQAIARAHRMGRQGVVVVKRYITQNSIEEYVEKLKADKSTLETSYFSDELEHTPFSSITELFEYFNV